jgi:hypothetical protein
MASKESGMGMTVSVDDATPTLQDLSNDITNLTWGTPRGVQDTTGVDKSAMERLLLLADYSVGLNGVFNDAATQSHLVFESVGDPANDATQQRTVTILISGQQVTGDCVFPDYPLTRAASGEATWAVTGQLASGTAAVWSTP